MVGVKTLRSCVAAFLLAAVAHASAQPGAESLARALDSAINSGNREQLSELLAPQFRQHPQAGELFLPPGTRESYINSMLARRAGLEDFQRQSAVLAAGGNGLSLMVTTSGTQRQPYLGQPPSGRQLRLRSLEVWRIEDGKLIEQWSQQDDIDVLRQITDWQPVGGLNHEPVSGRKLVHFDPGVFLESVVAAKDGTLYFTLLMTGRIMQLDPDGTLSVFAELPVGGKSGVPEGIMCLVLGEDGAIYASAIAPGSAHHGVWRVSNDGNARHIAPLPDKVLPNGIARDDAGFLYIADSGAGGVWRISEGEQSAQLWYEGDLLRRRPYIGIYPPANGIQYWEGDLYVANSDLAHIVRIPIASDGWAGQATVHASGVPGDDFAIAKDGTLYVTTHPYNSVIRVDREGGRTLIAGPEQGIVGPTAATFARRAAGEAKLYVVTDGGFFNPLPEQPLRPNLVELDIVNP
ncbi:MAG: ester cyclase [Haliea sp.]|uniref:ester cyclase n=1 Tax=Marinobacter salarius TaxID=1420917 RepID=UPI0032EB996D